MKAFKLTIVAVFLVSTGVAFYFAAGPGHGVYYVKYMKDRNPAAIRKDLDFSIYESSERLSASQKRLIEGAKVYEKEDQVGIELGQFLTKSKDDRRLLACDVYDKISMQFEGEGIMEGGEKPALELEGGCQTNFSDISKIAAIWIPVKKITEGRPVDMDLAFPEMAGVQFRFQNMGSAWPQAWVLKSVRLYNESDPSQEVRINQQELREILDKPFVMNW